MSLVKKSIEYWKWEWVPSFSIEELYSPSLISKGTTHIHDPIAVLKLQHLRDVVHKEKGGGLLVNFGQNRLRGVRSIPDQISLASQGGAKTHSMHLTGKAFDVTMTEGHDSEWLGRKAIELGWGGVGFYDTFVHIDNRLSENSIATVWDNRS